MNDFQPEAMAGKFEEIFNGNEEFRERLTDFIRTRYTVTELIDLLECEEGHEKEWIARFDDELNKIQFEEGMEMFCLEMEKLRDMFRSYMTLTTIFPVMLQVFLRACTFALELLEHCNIQYLKETDSWTVSGEESIFEDSVSEKKLNMVGKLYLRACHSLMAAIFIILAKNMGNIISRQPLSSINWNEKKEKLEKVDENGEKMCDFSTFLDFEEYLRDKTTMFESSNSVSFNSPSSPDCRIM